MHETTAWRYLTWLGTALAVIALLVFFSNAWPLILFGLGLSVVLAFVTRKVKTYFAVRNNGG